MISRNAVPQDYGRFCFQGEWGSVINGMYNRINILKVTHMHNRIIALVALLIVAPTFALADIGRVKRAKGAASVERAGKSIAAKPGLVLQANDVLVTGVKSQISVTFVDNSRFSAGPNSRVMLETFKFNPTTHEGTFLTTLEKGSLAVISGQIAKQTSDAMQVRTPTSILGVRGTRFIVEAGQ